MNQELWSAVDAYVTETVQATDAVLEAVLHANRAAGMPQIDVSPPGSPVCLQTGSTKSTRGG